MREVDSFHFRKGMVTGICLSPDNSILAASGTNLMLWEFANRKFVSCLEDNTSRFTFTHCVAFSPDGRYVVAGTGDHERFGAPFQNCGIKIWNAATLELVAHLEHQTPVKSLKFSGDGRKLIAGSEGEAIVWTLDW